jgi:hypothetical protein
MSILGPWWYISLVLFNFFSDCIDLDIRQRWRYGSDLRGSSSDDAHISGITNDTLNLDSH